MKTCTVHFDSWAGRLKARAEVLGECTRKGRPHYIVRLLEDVCRNRAGGVLYPPKHAVTDVREEEASWPEDVFVPCDMIPPDGPVDPEDAYAPCG